MTEPTPTNISQNGDSIPSDAKTNLLGTSSQEIKNDFRLLRKLRKAIRTFEGDASQKEVIAKLRRIERRVTYRYDFLRFILEVLGAEKHGEAPVPLAPVHRRLCRHIRTCRNLGVNCFVRLPRYHLKTQIATIYYRIWRLCNSPELCSIIVSGTLSLSKDTAGAIRREISNNATLKMFYPDVLPDWIRNERKNKWSEIEFNVARRGNYAQSTIEAVGVDATVTGKHFGEISFDDIVTKENSTTPEQCEKVIKAYKFFLSVVNLKKVRGKIPIMVVGTNYSDGDLYAFMEQPEVKHTFRSFVQPVFDHNGEPIWKDQHTKESLEMIKAQQGSYIFAGQYLLDPVPESQQEFKRSWIQTFTDLPKDVNGNPLSLEGVIIVDPITAKKTTSTSLDRGVILVIKWDKRKNIYVVDYKLYDRAREAELFDGIFEMADKHQVFTCLWESVAYQAQGAINLKEKIAQFNRNLRVIEVNPGHTDKDVRIRTLVPHFERGQIYIRYWMHELILELVRFPYGKTKDIIDALVYGLRHVVGTIRKGVWRTAASESSQKPFYL